MRFAALECMGVGYIFSLVDCVAKPSMRSFQTPSPRGDAAEAKKRTLQEFEAKHARTRGCEVGDQCSECVEVAAP